MRLRLWVAPLLLALACVAGDASPTVGFRASWLNPRGSIPESVTAIDVRRIMPDGTELELFQTSVERLEDMDDNGRRELAVGDLPTGEFIDLEIRGCGSACSGDEVVTIGRSGPILLEVGERRYVDIAMYELRTSQPVDRSDPPVPAVFTTATTLADGRVLLAGGFDDVEKLDSCPDTLTLPAGEPVCYSMVATDQAYLYEPASAVFTPTQGAMLAARGGHTATRLDDGRVLLAGGASRATMAIVKVGMLMNFREVVFHVDADDATLATSEIFDPELGREAEDTGRDGDPGRGLFVGQAEMPTEAMPLNQGRFLHAAAAVPGSQQAVLAGGYGGGGRTFEVFDGDKPGGPGVYDNTASPRLGAERLMPSALALGQGDELRVWIVGGARARSNGELADAWSPDPDDPTGVLSTGSELGFPGGDTDRPEFALMRPVVAEVEGRGFVTGWYGPRCPIDGHALDPVFESDDGTEICGPIAGVRSFTIDNDTATATPTPTSSSVRHAFASGVTLGDGRVLVHGGSSDALLQPTEATLIYDAELEGGLPSGRGSNRLERGRLFPASARLLDGGVLIVGGLRIVSGDVPALAAPEAMMYSIARNPFVGGGMMMETGE